MGTREQVLSAHMHRNIISQFVKLNLAGIVDNRTVSDSNVNLGSGRIQDTLRRVFEENEKIWAGEDQELCICVALSSSIAQDVCGDFDFLLNELGRLKMDERKYLDLEELIVHTWGKVVRGSKEVLKRHAADVIATANPISLLHFANATPVSPTQDKRSSSTSSAAYKNSVHSKGEKKAWRSLNMQHDGASTTEGKSSKTSTYRDPTDEKDKKSKELSGINADSERLAQLRKVLSAGKLSLPPRPAFSPAAHSRPATATASSSSSPTVISKRAAAFEDDDYDSSYVSENQDEGEKYDPTLGVKPVKRAKFEFASISSCPDISQLSSPPHFFKLMHADDVISDDPPDSSQQVPLEPHNGFERLAMRKGEVISSYASASHVPAESCHPTLTFDFTPSSVSGSASVTCTSVSTSSRSFASTAAIHTTSGTPCLNFLSSTLKYKQSSTPEPTAEPFTAPVPRSETHRSTLTSDFIQKLKGIYGALTSTSKDSHISSVPSLVSTGTGAAATRASTASRSSQSFPTGAETSSGLGIGSSYASVPGPLPSTVSRVSALAARFEEFSASVNSPNDSPSISFVSPIQRCASADSTCIPSASNPALGPTWSSTLPPSSSSSITGTPVNRLIEVNFDPLGVYSRSKLRSGPTPIRKEGTLVHEEAGSRNAKEDTAN